MEFSALHTWLAKENCFLVVGGLGGRSSAHFEAIAGVLSLMCFTRLMELQTSLQERECLIECLDKFFANFLGVYCLI